jgi:hypothetical protein
MNQKFLRVKEYVMRIKLFRHPHKERGREVTEPDAVESVLNATGAFPKIFKYAGYEGNYGSHAMGFEFLGVRCWFSYQSLVAYKVPYKPRVILQNYWGPTTGRHLKYVKWLKGYLTDYLIVTKEEFLVRFNNDLRAYLKKNGLSCFTYPDLRVDQDPKTLDYTGFIGICKPGEPAVPEPKPPKSAYHLYPKKPSKSWFNKQAAAERRVQRQEKLRATIEENYVNTLVEFKGEMI